MQTLDETGDQAETLPLPIIRHYLLFTTAQTTIAQAQILVAQTFIRRTGATAGFAADLCRRAGKVTVIGQLEPELRRSLEEAGILVQEVQADLYHLATALEELP